MSYTLKPGETAPIFAVSGATVPINSVEADALFAAWGNDRRAHYAALAERQREEHRQQGEAWAPDANGVWAWRKVQA